MGIYDLGSETGMNINDEVRYLGQTWTIYAMDGDCCYLEGSYHEEQTIADAADLELVRERYGEAAYLDADGDVRVGDNVVNDHWDLDGFNDPSDFEEDEN